MKKCSQCQRVKSFDFFTKLQSAKDGHAQICRPCRSIKSPYSRDRYLRRNYGIGLHDYNKILSVQKHLCAICKTPESELPLALCVDHNHVFKYVRGLLCVSCNARLGILERTGVLTKNISFREETIEYLLYDGVDY